VRKGRGRKAILLIERGGIDMSRSTSTLAQDLIRIHRIITRALNTDTVKGVEYLQSGFPSDDEMLGYGKYNHCLMSVLSSHLQSEDLIAFRVFRKWLPLAPYEQMTAEHHRIEALMSLIPGVIKDISSDSPMYGLRVLILILRKISKLWSAHSELEEGYFSDTAITAAINEELQLEIDDAVSKLRLESTSPPYWVVPFLLYPIEQPDRTSITVNHPSQILVDLLQHRWAYEWSPSEPIVLE
jgi:hypothetical protein